MNSIALYTLDVREPDGFVVSYSQDTGSRYLLGAISDPASVRIVSDRGSLNLNSELITIADHRVLRTILISGQPCEFEEAVATAKKLCRLVGISSNKIENWSEGRATHPTDDRECLQIETNEFGNHSVEIWESGYATGPPSRVRYRLSWEP